MDPRPQIGKIITADISDEAKRLILGAFGSDIKNLEDLKSKFEEEQALNEAKKVHKQIEDLLATDNCKKILYLTAS